MDSNHGMTGSKPVALGQLGEYPIVVEIPPSLY